MAKKKAPLTLGIDTVTDIEDAACALAEGLAIERGLLSMQVCCDWSADIFVRDPDEQPREACLVTWTDSYADRIENGGSSHAQFYRATATAFINCCDHFESTGEFMYLCGKRNLLELRETEVRATLGELWHKDQLARARARKIDSIDMPTATRFTIGAYCWTIDPKQLFAWARAHNKDAVCFLPPGADPDEQLHFRLRAIAQCSLVLRMPGPVTCWTPGWKVCFRWREGKGGLNLLPYTHADHTKVHVINLP